MLGSALSVNRAPRQQPNQVNRCVRKQSEDGLVFLAEPIAAAGHVEDGENGESDEGHDSSSVHRFLS